MNNKIAIIGGGIGGLTAAALLAQDGFNVQVFEASREWGGCAGKFHRGPYTFPVGATLGMGFELNGIHDRVLKQLGTNVETEPLDEVMHIHFPHRSFVFYRDRTRHVQELQNAFPHLREQIGQFYQELFQIAGEIRKLMGPLPVLPPVTPSEWTRLLQSLSLSSLQLVPWFPKTLVSLLTKHQLAKEKDFKSFIDGVVIDSMQATSDECSLLLGCLALDIYHEGAYYVKGGLFKLAEALVQEVKQHGGVAKLSRRITHIQKDETGWLLTDQRDNQYQVQHVVYNGHLSALKSLLEAREYKALSRKARVEEGARQWGTFTLYLAISDEYLPANFPLFQQVVLSSEHGLDDGNHLFISTSQSDDYERAPSGKRTITISTHLDLQKWQDHPAPYEQKKEEMTKRFLTGLKKVIPAIEKSIHLEVPGTPHAWETYTLRKNGEVGGYAQTPNRSLFNSISHRSGVKNLWLCGDSIFPGAGTIGVTVSGYHVYQSIKKDALS